MSLTRQMAHLIARKPVGPADRQAAALFTLDLVANALAGRNSDAGRILLRWADERPAGSEQRAFLAGALSHILETDDLHRTSVVHPGCVVVPASLAIGHDLGVRGHAFLDSVLWGYEAACRVGNAVGAAHYRIWHNTATCGPFGSALAGAKLYGLGFDQTVDALGNAGTQSAGLWQFLETGAMSKHLHAGRGAQAGVLAASLARYGFTGPPAILEGEKGFFRATCADARPDLVVKNADAPWALVETSIKPWPSCRHTHPAIDAALEISRSIDVGRVERAEVETYQAAMDVCDRPEPRSVYEAKFSLHHCVAAALSGNVDFSSFEAPARERLASLRSRVSPRVVEPYKSAYPIAWGSAVRVTIDGHVIEQRRQHAKGDPEAALSHDEMIAKARMLLNHGGVGDADSIINGILALADDAPLPSISFKQPSQSTEKDRSWRTDHST